MAQTGYTPILIYSSSTASQLPSASNLTNSTLGSELAINITDGKLFYKDNANAVQVIGWKTTPTTAGGTGLTSYTAGDLLYYATGTTLSKLGIGSSGTILKSTGSAPAWETVANLAVESISFGTTGLTPSTATKGVVTVAGTLIAANGGTGFASYAVGDLLYADTTTTLAKLADVATGNALISGGVGVAPSWGKIGLTTHVSGTLAVGNGGSGATTLTGYLIGNGASAFTASSTIPNTDITGLGTMSTQAANNVAITGGSLTGVGPVYQSTGSFSASGSSTTTITTLTNSNVQKNYYIMLSQQGGTGNVVFALLNAYGSSAGAFRIYQDNTNPVLDMNITTSGLNVQLVIGSGFGSTTWRWYLVQFGG